MITIIYINKKGNYCLMESEAISTPLGPINILNAEKELISIIDEEDRKAIYKCSRYHDHFKILKKRYSITT